MAELLLVIFIMVVLAATYFLSRQFDDTMQVLMAWGVGVLIIVGALVYYISSKVDTVAKKLPYPYTSEGLEDEM